MADRHTPAPSHPATWADAFAALPQESPPADAWQRVASRLPTPRRPRWPAWAAAAAVLAVVVAAPLKLRSPEAPAPQVDATTRTDGAASGGNDVDRVAVRAQRDSGQAPPQAIAGAPPATDVAETDFAERDIAEVASPAGEDGPPPGDAATEPLQRPEVAGVATAVPDADGGAASPASQPAELEHLYAESAQLEALLALARDDRVASGTAAALASDHDAQVGAIDAALMQPDLDPARRAELWRDRVAALRQAAAFESTRRMLAAQGERYDTMLVSID